ncbi:hypothetical protein [Mycolicibacter kumamotonensis]|uniref:hypothetical protein n=1 Tax=Mycolicibacter kumamotonensis TaxID=354243 RepID=UPI001969DC93|nr:hypothetical protein [Mycolicibacter kumamotonensis]
MKPQCKHRIALRVYHPHCDHDTTVASTSADRKHLRSSAVLGVLAVLLAAAALAVAIVALTRIDATPTYSAAQRVEAQARLCDQYKLAAQAVHLETTQPDGDVALARIANTNGALILATAASEPALDVKFRDCRFRSKIEQVIPETAQISTGADRRCRSSVGDLLSDRDSYGHHGKVGSSIHGGNRRFERRVSGNADTVR